MRQLSTLLWIISPSVSGGTPPTRAGRCTLRACMLGTLLVSRAIGCGCTLCQARACGMLIGACNPTSCPIHGSWLLGLGFASRRLRCPRSLAHLGVGFNAFLELSPVELAPSRWPALMSLDVSHNELDDLVPFAATVRRCFPMFGRLNSLDSTNAGTAMPRCVVVITPI